MILKISGKCFSRLRMKLNLCSSIFYSRKNNIWLSAYLEIFKPCSYFLRIKKKSGKFLVTQGRVFDWKSGNHVVIFNIHNMLY